MTLRKAMRCILMTAAVAVAMSAAWSCNTSGCTDNQNSLPYAGFYSSATGDAISVSGLEIGGVGAPGDSLLYTSDQKLANVYLPLRSNSGVTAYCFHYDQEGIDSEAMNDTITFYYSSRPFFASEECGAMLEYDIQRLTWTTHVIDTVEIVDSLVTNTDIERIKIYFRTQE
ncbi:MAG: DUF6452 family protein [Bacteroides sp.]|nr:DUF6452 family protein [Bacteroides sp.]